MPRWGSVNFKDLERFRQNLLQLEQDSQRFCEECARELAARLLALVIPRTPVGRKPSLNALGGDGATKTTLVKGTNPKGRSRSFLTRPGAILEKYWAGYVGGTLRRGWTAKTEAEAKSGGSTNGAAYARSLPVAKSGGDYVVTVQNPVNYASYVEFGHRQTPGRFVPQIGKRLKAAWVKGQFMLTISEADLRTIAPGLLEKKLAQYLKGALNGRD